MNSMVSVIIPTRNRSSLVARAVKSALAQTLNQIEVVVVVDGPDQETVQLLSTIADPRLRVVQVAESRGAAAARNTGVSTAAAEWIAFLDDDDEWFPKKLELQFSAAQRSSYAYPIITSRLIARTPKGDFLWPRRLPKHDEDPGDYLFIRKSFFMGEALILTSTILTKKQLLEKVPFRVDLRKNQDSDWVLRASKISGVGVDFVEEPLAIWYREERRKAISESHDWQHTLDWAKEIQALISEEAYASIILVFGSVEAAGEGDRSAFLLLLKDAFRNGKPTIIPLVLYGVNWLIPQSVRRSIRATLMRQRASSIN